MKFINFIATIETQMFCCFKLYVKCTLQDLFELIERQVKKVPAFSCCLTLGLKKYFNGDLCIILAYFRRFANCAIFNVLLW